jgi:homoserine O-acetyltransferase/O-succinyltransferase
MSINNFKLQQPFPLESGAVLSELNLAYTTFGSINKNRDNVVWVVHALTANSDPTDWWPNVVGSGYVINPEEHFIICVNNLGSPYGSTAPLTINPEIGKPYFHDFPLITTKDIAKSFSILKKHLNIQNIKLLIGASMGGQAAMEFAILEGVEIKNLILIATNAKHSPWGIAFNESQRLAIEADNTWRESNELAGVNGLKAARSIALLSYRTPKGYNFTQKDDDHKLEDFRATTYQQYQGLKLVNRYNAFSYYSNTKTMDSHNVGRGHDSIQSALSKITATTIIVGILSDLLFPIEDQRFLHQNMEHSTLHEIDSFLGHDGFLTEFKLVSDIISKGLK